jgi:hypothetical protein
MTIMAMPDGSNPDLGIGAGGMFGGAYPRAGFVNVPQPKKRGMFAGAEINPGNAIAGFLAGMFPQYAGSFLAPMMQRQRMEYDAQQQQSEHDHQLQDAKDLYDYKRNNPEPINNDTANDYSFWRQHLTPDQFQQWIESKVNPPQYMNVPGVGLVQIPKGAPAAPTAPVGKLTPLGAGGPSPSGSGTFHN